VTKSSNAFLPRNAADSSIVDQSCCIAPSYLKMQGLKSLTLHWRSCVGHCDEVVESICA